MNDEENCAPIATTLGTDFDAMADAVTEYRRQLRRYKWALAVVCVLFALCIVGASYWYIQEQAALANAEDWREKYDRERQKELDALIKDKQLEARLPLQQQIVKLQHQFMMQSKDSNQKVDKLQGQLKAANDEIGKLNQQLTEANVKKLQVKPK
jgi:hypothetical protein